MAGYSEFYREIYAAIGELTPLSDDCGRICGKRCCHGSSSDGMLLFPHEEELLGNQFVTSADCGKLFVCNGRCERQSRPLACRIFPLLPVFDGERIRVAVNAAAYRLCPLAQNSDNVRFDRRFIRAVRRAGRLLCRDDECRRYIADISSENSDLLRLLPISDGIVSGKRL